MKKKKPDYFHGDTWFNRKVGTRTDDSMARSNANFARMHKQDTDGQLLEYVRQRAAQLGYTPNAKEVVGSGYIISRFGNWPKTVAAAGLPPVDNTLDVRRRNVYKQEFKQQAKHFKAEREAAKEIRAAKAAKAQEEANQQLERDMAWGKEHRNDSDEQLLDYVRQCAAELGHTPVGKEVLGSRYIGQRFGNWAVVIHLAGLPLRHGMKPPEQSALERYRKMQKEWARQKRMNR